MKQMFSGLRKLIKLRKLNSAALNFFSTAKRLNF